MSSMDIVKKRIIFSMGAIVLLIITLVGITYAYFVAKVQGNTNDRSASIGAGMLRLTYGDGNSNITAEKIIPGKVIEEKTFTVKNTGTGIVENYDVYLENVINELENYEDLTYVLTCESDDNNKCLGSEGIFPKAQQVIATNTIDVNVTHTYKIVVTYKETNTDQSVDMNKTIDAKINIKDDISNIKQLKIYGNSIQEGEPSLDSSVEIQSLGNKTSNIFDKSLSLIEDIQSETSFTGYASVLYTNENVLNMLKPDTQYTISFDVELISVPSNTPVQESFNPVGFLLHSGQTGYDDVSLWYQQIDLTPGYKQTFTRTFTTPSNLADSNANYRLLAYSGRYIIDDSQNSPGTVIFRNIKIEEGANATTYEPYGYKVPIEISKKNLFDVDNANVINGYLSNNQLLGYLESPISTATIVLPCESNTIYTISREIIGNRFAVGSSEYEPANNIDLTSYEMDYTAKSLTITSGSNDKYLYIWFYNENYDTDYTYLELMKDIKVEKGTVVTEENTVYFYLDEPLRKVGDYADYIDFENSVVVRNVNKVTLTGEESWSNADNGLTNTYRASTKILDLSSSDKIPLITNKIPVILTGTSSSDTENLQASAGSVYLRILRSRLNDLGYEDDISGFREWIKNNNIDLYYPINSKSSVINVPQIQVSSDLNIKSCSDNGVCASNIEIEYDS